MILMKSFSYSEDILYELKITIRDLFFKFSKRMA